MFSKNCVGGRDHHADQRPAASFKGNAYAIGADAKNTLFIELFTFRDVKNERRPAIFRVFVRKIPHGQKLNLFPTWQRLQLAKSFAPNARVPL